MSEPKIPNHIVEAYGTARAFKQAKRSDFRAVLKALHEFQRGCAYCPGYNNGLNEWLIEALTIKDSLSVKRWGR